MANPPLSTADKPGICYQETGTYFRYCLTDLKLQKMLRSKFTSRNPAA